MNASVINKSLDHLKVTTDYQYILSIVKEFSDLKVYDLIKYFDRESGSEYVLQELATIEVAVERNLIEVSQNGEITYLVAGKTLEREDAK